MNHQALNLMFAKVSLESVLQFIGSPRNAEIYNGGVVLFLALIGLALCWGCVYLTTQFSSKSVANPRKLFMRMCCAHQLSGSERRQLEQLARLLGLETPAILMIDASLWNIDELSSAKKLKPKQRERLLNLQKILYDQPRLSVSHDALTSR
jgi:hypothetical protein